MASHSKTNPNRILNPLVLLEQALLLRYAHFAILWETPSLPEDLLSEQLTILSDLRQETDKRIGNASADATKAQIQQVLRIFPKDP